MSAESSKYVRAIRNASSWLIARWRLEGRDNTAKMVSEFFREAAVLVFIFVPLDWIFEGKNTLDWRAVTGILFGSGLLLALGVTIERLREP